MFSLLATSSAPTASAVKGTEQYANGLTGVDLYQAGSYGSPVMPEKQVRLFDGRLVSVQRAPKLKHAKALRSWTRQLSSSSRLSGWSIDNGGRPAH